jgi:hypothetical protein
MRPSDTVDIPNPVKAPITRIPSRLRTLVHPFIAARLSLALSKRGSRRARTLCEIECLLKGGAVSAKSDPASMADRPTVRRSVIEPMPVERRERAVARWHRAPLQPRTDRGPRAL